MLWFEQWLEWWRWLIPSWHVVLESSMDQILGADTPGQHVPPRVWYGKAFLLIRNAIGCLSCLVEWGLVSLFVTYFVKMPKPHGARGAFAGESLALQVGCLLTGYGAIATHMTCLTSRSNSLKIYGEDSCEIASI
jgi:hypothetical protein